jgi:hypothetical protein
MLTRSIRSLIAPFILREGDEKRREKAFKVFG